MKVLITGAAGYIGSQLGNSLARSGHEIVGIDDASASRYSSENVVYEFPIKKESILDFDRLCQAVAFENFDAVIHLAAIKSVVSTQSDIWLNRVNIDGTANVLHMATELGISNVIFSSTAAVYSGECPQTGYSETSEKIPISSYGKSKLIAEEMSQNWLSESIENNLTIFRFFNVGGAIQGHPTERIADNLIPKLFQSSKSGDLFEIFGSNWDTTDGFAVRDYVHISDLIQFISSSLFEREIHSRSQNTFNLGSGKGFSVMEVIKEFMSVTQKEFRYELREKRDGEVGHAIANVDLARKVFKLNFTKNLNEIIEDYNSSYKW